MILSADGTSTYVWHDENETPVLQQPGAGLYPPPSFRGSASDSTSVMERASEEEPTEEEPAEEETPLDE